MPKRPRPLSPSSNSVGWSTNRRVAIGALAVAVLLALAAGVAWFSGGDDGRHAPGTTTQAAVPSPSSSPSIPKTAVKSGSVAKPPQVTEPVAYAKAAARMLWSYNTRDTSRDQQLAGMRVWMTTEARYADWDSVSGQVPDPVLWSRMADQDQHAAGTVAEGHYPGAFKQALADEPSAITKAYVYVVTVNGKQEITWKKGGGAEERSVTLAVQCRPGHDCALAAIAPTVTQ
ncbi:hypothetical protein [Streptomyces sp. NPDC003435]